MRGRLRCSTAALTVDPAFRVADVDPRLYGSFVEHMGRCVYDGIYEPEHPEADEAGFRSDVADLVRELGRAGHPLSRWQLRVGVQLGGRDRPG